MLYPKDTIEEKLGFDKIRQLLKENCISVLGQDLVDEMQFSTELEFIQLRIRQTDEFKKILESGANFPQQHYLNVLPFLDKILIEGAFLDEREFDDLKLSLRTIFACTSFFEQVTEVSYPLLRDLALEVEVDKKLLKRLENVIDDRGLMRDTASSELNMLRKEIVDEQSRLRRKVEQILRSAQKNGFTDEESNYTIRNGRLVIPVLAEYKRKIPGFIHDESATGQTVFLEPTEILEQNNLIKELEYRERREVIRILTALTAELRPAHPALKKAYGYLALVDFIRAKAKLAVKVNAFLPELQAKPTLQWHQAQHPLLYLSHQAQQKSTVAQDIRLVDKQRILIISGPNSGGKSVTLKTIGLLQYMLQCGLLISVSEGSKAGIFRDIFIDIGDEQSLENDLSTYSSHLRNMKYFLRFADNRTLFLIDEFGAGTEPTAGAAIAEAILEKLHVQKAFGVITTHYTNLKVYAQEHEGLVNGAMRFDAANLEPLYQLEIGKPGSSFAFEIAQKIGLPQPILQSSREKMGQEQVNLEKLLRELDTEKQSLMAQNQQFTANNEELAHLRKSYQALEQELRQNKQRLMNQAKVEAQMLMKQANQQIEQTIRQIKENQAEKEATKEARKQLETFQTKLQVEPEAPTEKPTEEEVVLEGGEIEIGSLVRIKGQETIGEVMTLKEKEAEIMLGELKMTVKRKQLEKVSRKTLREVQKSSAKVKGINLAEKMADFNPRLDVRGQRAEDAVKAVEDLMDTAILLGHSELYIVHGKGDGILRTTIRNRMAKYKQVASMQDEHADRGGAGITLVYLK